MAKMNYDTFEENNEGSVYRYSKADLRVSNRLDFADRDKEIEHLQKESSRMLDEIFRDLQNL